MSFFTCFWLFPQKEHLRRSPPSPMRATRRVLSVGSRVLASRERSRGMPRCRDWVAKTVHPRQTAALSVPWLRPVGDEDAPPIGYAEGEHAAQADLGTGVLSVSRMVSISPYSTASSDVSTLSRSMSRLTSSIDLLELSEIIFSRRARIRRISLAWISMSDDCP